MTTQMQVPVPSFHYPSPGTTISNEQHTHFNIQPELSLTAPTPWITGQPGRSYPTSSHTYSGLEGPSGMASIELPMLIAAPARMESGEKSGATKKRKLQVESQAKSKRQTSGSRPAAMVPGPSDWLVSKKADVPFEKSEAALIKKGITHLIDLNPPVMQDHIRLSECWIKMVWLYRQESPGLPQHDSINFNEVLIAIQSPLEKLHPEAAKVCECKCICQSLGLTG